jgi:hypothetical protein
MVFEQTVDLPSVFRFLIPDFCFVVLYNFALIDYYFFLRGHNSAGRVSASQAESRGFDSRCPLHPLKIPVSAGFFIGWRVIYTKFGVCRLP